MTSIMTPVLLLLLFQSVRAFPQGADPAVPRTDILVDKDFTTGDEIEKANVNLTTFLTDGDIMPYSQRNADPCVALGCMWLKSGNYVYVPVKIDPDFTSNERIIIINALVSFHEDTCIRFVWRTGQRDYIQFYPGQGCWSYLGRTRGKQLISLQQRGCVLKRTVQHEVLHALAFNHEQVRSDRDDFVTILTENIRAGAERNFEKKETYNLGTRYDFKSVMHYSKYAFSKNGQPTIIAKNNPDRNFGNARSMSNNDIDRINKLYQCSV